MLDTHWLHDISLVYSIPIHVFLPPPPHTQSDLLNPLTSIEWNKCSDTPTCITCNTDSGQLAFLDGKLYLEAEDTSHDRNCQILCYDCAVKSWTSIKSPTLGSAFTTYQRRLVLIGGIEVATGQLTNKLWSLQDDGTWAEELPPMLTPRTRATALSIGHHLQHVLVAGGLGGGTSSAEVEVFDGRRWTRAQPLPEADYNMKCAFLKGEWYLMGGVSQGSSVFSATVDTLIASASAGGETPSVWRRLPCVPNAKCCAAVFGGHLLAIGGVQLSSSPKGMGIC